ncbi:hypothetical protein G9A89_019151 [Geosiphon pyriformis]|nr:hypothetical protein G9A89_019151 [Geosiphon pyriformis]
MRARMERITDSSILELLTTYAIYAARAMCLDETDGQLSAGIYGKTEVRGLELILYLRGDRLSTELEWRSRPKSFVPYPGIRGGMVDAVWYRIFRQADNSILNIVQNAMIKQPIRDITVIGHGVGGVYAILAMLQIYSVDGDRLKQSYIPINLKAVTFGQPRLGNRKMMSLLNELQYTEALQIWRVTNMDDLVPRLPQRGITGEDYAHPLSEYWLEGQCDCEGISFVYWCHGPRNVEEDEFFFEESERCVNQYVEPRIQPHNGPYFNVLMEYSLVKRSNWNRKKAGDAQKFLIESPFFYSRIKKYAQIASLAYHLNRTHGWISPGIWGKTMYHNTTLLFYVKGFPWSPDEWRRKPNIFIKYDGIDGAKVDCTWEMAYRGARKKIQNLLQIFVENNIVTRIIALGHGVGGVYAIFAMLEFLKIRQDIPLYVYTFGQPRFGNINFARYLNELKRLRKLHIYRVTHTDDKVPSLPATGLHGEEYFHSVTEVWISTEDCDCDSASIYFCYGDVVGKAGEAFITESKFANPTFLNHNGPYLGVIMDKRL